MWSSARGTQFADVSIGVAQIARVQVSLSRRTPAIRNAAKLPANSQTRTRSDVLARPDGWGSHSRHSGVRAHTPVPGRMSWLGPMAGEATAGPASSEIKPLLTDLGNSQTNQVNPLNFQNSESSATDISSILPLKLPELPLDEGSQEKS